MFYYQLFLVVKQMDIFVQIFDFYCIFEFFLGIKFYFCFNNNIFLIISFFFNGNLLELNYFFEDNNNNYFFLSGFLVINNNEVEFSFMFKDLEIVMMEFELDNSFNGCEFG